MHCITFETLFELRTKLGLEAPTRAGWGGKQSNLRAEGCETGGLNERGSKGRLAPEIDPQDGKMPLCSGH